MIRKDLGTVSDGEDNGEKMDKKHIHGKLTNLRELAADLMRLSSACEVCGLEALSKELSGLSREAHDIASHITASL